MSIRTVALSSVVVMVAGFAGIASSRQPVPPPLAATVADVPGDALAEAGLAAARRDPLAQRLRGVLAEAPGGQQTLARISASDVPVLGPPTPALLQAATFLDGERHYMLVIEQPGRIIEIYGATQAFRAPAGSGEAGSAGLPQGPGAPTAGLAPRTPPGALRAAVRAPATDRPQNVQVERTEYGIDVAFSRYGAVYNVSFICDAPNGADCSEAEATAFVASLVLLGGGA